MPLSTVKISWTPSWWNSSTPHIYAVAFPHPAGNGVINTAANHRSDRSNKAVLVMPSAS